MMINTDVVIVGTGVAGLFAALHLPRDKKIVMITKADLESSPWKQYENMRLRNIALFRGIDTVLSEAGN